MPAPEGPAQPGPGLPVSWVAAPAGPAVRRHEAGGAPPARGHEAGGGLLAAMAREAGERREEADRRRIAGPKARRLDIRACIARAIGGGPLGRLSDTPA